jgi:hypothetical protein
VPDEPEQPAAAEPGPPTPVEVGVGFGLVLVLTVLLCLWGAFLLPLRVGGVRVPVSLLVAGLGNAALGWAGGRLLGVPGVLVPGLVWLGMAVTLGTRRAEGDLVVTGDLVGTLFLFVGALGFAIAYGVSSARPREPPPSWPTPTALHPRGPPADDLRVDTAQEHVVVRLGGCRYALPLSSVAEVGRPPALTRVPGPARMGRRAANWRGRVLAVPRRPGDRGGGGYDPLGRTARIGRAIAGRRGVSIGLLVEGLDGHGRAGSRPEAVEPALALAARVAPARCCRGQSTDTDGPLRPASTSEQVFGLADELPRARRAS